MSNLRVDNPFGQHLPRGTWEETVVAPQTILAIVYAPEIPFIDADPLTPDIPAPINLDWETNDLIFHMLKILPPREAFILYQHYLNGMTLKEIGEILGVSSGRVRTLEVIAFRRLWRLNPSRFHKDAIAILNQEPL